MERLRWSLFLVLFDTKISRMWRNAVHWNSEKKSIYLSILSWTRSCHCQNRIARLPWTLLRELITAQTTQSVCCSRLAWIFFNNCALQNIVFRRLISKLIKLISVFKFLFALFQWGGAVADFQQNNQPTDSVIWSLFYRITIYFMKLYSLFLLLLHFTTLK